MKTIKQDNNKASALHNIRHSLAHLLASAVLEMFPKAQLGVGPVIENGFYYDFLLPRSLTPEDVNKLEKRMRELAKQKLPFARQEMTTKEAKKFFTDKQQPFKVELVEDIEKFRTTKADEILNSDKKLGAADKTKEKAGNVSLYTTGKFIDLCRGGHVENTSEIATDAFKLDKVSGAYWRGDQSKAQLQRVYGLAFTNKAELDAYLAQVAEAEKRDHKKLGAQLDLFCFSELVGGGLPLFTPKGTIIRDMLDGYVWSLRKAAGYTRVDIPHITKKDLYEHSGHWDKFKDELFRITTREGHTFAMKPMNCPHHAQIYKRKKWSYRELPQRYASTTKVYRDEQTGELSGLSRVRSITQDDAHVFCRQSQIKNELKVVWNIVKKFYGTFGFKLRVRLSMHDPAARANYLGSDADWKSAEGVLRELAKEMKTETFEGVGEAAFYGPKLDFMATDSIGREWQVATIQLDFNQPQRFDLSCTGEDGQPERIFMVHAAIMGSIERFMNVFIEHTAGAFPTWVSPTQVTILPISKKQNKYAASVEKELLALLPDLRIEIDDRDESVGKKIREASMQKSPYMLILGEKEMKAKKIAVRGRGEKDHGLMAIKKFAQMIGEEIEKKK